MVSNTENSQKKRICYHGTLGKNMGNHVYLYIQQIDVEVQVKSQVHHLAFPLIRECSVCSNNKAHNSMDYYSPILGISLRLLVCNSLQSLLSSKEIDSTLMAFQLALDNLRPRKSSAVLVT